MKSFFILSAVLCGLTLMTTPSAHADAVTDWNAHFEEAVVATAQPVPVQPRNAAIMHRAIFDAVNGIERRYSP